MTKISELSENMRSIQQQNKKKTEPTDGNLFKATFDKALSGKTEGAAPEKASTLPPLGGVNAINYTSIDSVESGLDKKTYQLLDKLDQYSSKLGNPEISLKEIEPLITKINDEATELTRNVSENDESSPELKRLARESAVSANTEYIKFMRGDYV